METEFAGQLVGDFLRWYHLSPHIHLEMSVVPSFLAIPFPLGHQNSTESSYKKFQWFLSPNTEMLCRVCKDRSYQKVGETVYPSSMEREPTVNEL